MNYCGNCNYLNITEEQQTKKHEIHYCNKYNKRVLHKNKHPLLPKLKECFE